MLRKWLLLILLIAFLSLTAGCWDRIEINDIALVLATGLDITKDGKLEGTIQIALPAGIPNPGQSGGGKGQQSVMLLSETGDNLYEIVQKMQEKLSRRIFLGHRGILILGEKLARHGIKDIMDGLSRSVDSRLNTFILTSRSISAKKVLETKYVLEKVPAEGLKELERSDIGLSVNLTEFLDMIASESAQPVTDAVTLYKGNAPADTLFQFSGTALYHSDKLIGFLSDKETKYLQMVKGKRTKTNILAKIPDMGNASMNVLRSNPIVTPELEHGHVKRIRIELNIQGRLMENNTGLDLSNSKNLMLIQKNLNLEIQKKIENLINQSQKKWKLDIFGFGEIVHVKHPMLWKEIKKDWNSLYASTPVSVRVQTNIVRIGRSMAPIQLKENEIRK